MKITYIKKEVDGVISEEIFIDEVQQIGFSSPVPLGTMSLKTANELLKELSVKLSSIPF